MVARKPAVTVVIPTYNWSAALRCAIRSVLRQTVQDFELIVVGDGCTDDSEQVAASFNDPRIRWHNLDRNHGSQWAANNWANEHANGDWIAYLGHDDIWYPTHLEAVLHAAKREAADAVTSIMILYWPEATRGCSIAGLFATETYTSYDFVPPSAFAHARAMYGDVVKWRDPATITQPFDVAFVDELARKGRKFAQTRELTCFKFNAAWRRDIYKLKPVDEQERILAKIESGVDFRQEELVGALQAVVSSRFSATGAPPTAGIKEGEFIARNRRHKGVDSRFAPDELKRIEAPVHFDMATQAMPFEWHELEGEPPNTFRWTGLSPSATIDLPVIFDRDLSVRIQVAAMLRPELIESIKLSMHGRPLAFEVDRSQPLLGLVTKLRRAEIAETDRDFGITIEVPVTRPFDLGLGEDRRWLGAAIAWVLVAPLSE